MYGQVEGSTSSLAASRLKKEDELVEEKQKASSAPGGPVAGQAVGRCFPCVAANKHSPLKQEPSEDIVLCCGVGGVVNAFVREHTNCYPCNLFCLCKWLWSCKYVLSSLLIRFI